MTAGRWQGKEVPYIGEWVQHEELIANGEYATLAANFTAEDFSPKRWVDLARQAGMGYLVLTAKHHEGFALWHSRSDPFNAVDASACRRDLVAELAEACRDGGIRLGLYYSHCVDWREAHAGNLPGDEKNPERPPAHGRMWGNDWDFPPGNAAGFDEYLRRKVEPQLSELLSDYGDLALIWFDTPTASLQPQQAQRLRDLIKSHQPGCLVGGRIGHGFQDFDSLGDNQVPLRALQRPGESCMTLNDTWGYKEHDQQWAEPAEVIALLSACTARNANLLLNVGPRADGTLPEPAIARLNEVGRWMNQHGSAIHGGSASDLEWQPPWGELVRTGSHLHAIVQDQHCRQILLPHPAVSIESVVVEHATAVTWKRLPPPSADWLAIELPPPSDAMPRHITIRCAKVPTWPPQRSAMPGADLRLAAAAGVTATAQQWDGFGHAGQRISWDFAIGQAGRFLVYAGCGGDRYAEWYGGHHLAIHIGSLGVEAVIQAGTPETGRQWQHYPLHRCLLGELDLNAGSHRLELLIHSTSGAAAASIPFLLLERCGP